MDQYDIKSLRESFSITQQAFSFVLGLSFVTINRWERGHAAPSKLSLVKLTLLNGALGHHDPSVVLRALRGAGGDSVEIVRLLARMERGPTLTTPTQGA